MMRCVVDPALLSNGRRTELGMPMGDVRRLVDDAAAAGLDPGAEVLISFHVRFSGRPDWERAAVTAKDSWQVSAYSCPEGHMLGLTRRTPLTEPDLERQRTAIVRFVARYDATWESVTLEDPSPPSLWQTLAAELPQQPTETIELPAEPAVLSLPRAGGDDIA
jgi:hypothetical protein